MKSFITKWKLNLTRSDLTDLEYDLLFIRCKPTDTIE